MSSDRPYIEVAVALPVHNTFIYQAPDDQSSLAVAGKRALVPFRQRRITGYILGPGRKIDAVKIKTILDILDETPIFPQSMVPLFRWIADYYIHPIGDVIKTALPGGLTLFDFTEIAITKTGEAFLEGNGASFLEKEILVQLKKGPGRLNDLCRRLNRDIPGVLIQTMAQRGCISLKKEFQAQRAGHRMARYVSLGCADIAAEALSGSKKKIIDALKSEGEISLKDLKTRVATAPAHVRALEKKGQVKIVSRKVYRDPFGKTIDPDAARVLTEDQEAVFSRVESFLDKGFSTFLLTGVTGSGKTEIYMQLAENVIKKGRCVLMLVPEIALLSEMGRRFRARFGECVALLHSRLSQGERFDQWMRILHDQVPIVIGARSAIFAPLENLGLIVVDEEHDPSYKQEAGLRYNARDLATVRAKLSNCVALLGSATPAIDSYYNVGTGKFTEVTLKHRIEKRPLPEMTILDLRHSRDLRGPGRLITAELFEGMKETLERGEQVLIFLNRRGFANFPVCSACGETVKCDHCDISLTFHRETDVFKCHYCGFTAPGAATCKTCGAGKIKLLGFGTEKVEAAVKHLFPDAAVARMDRDTTVRKGSVLNILKGVRNQTIDILIGTQMVVKGHDFPNITLVGIICADLSLNFPDFRAEERTFQLLAQVSGRAGRGARPGKVILQTYNPEHFSIIAAKKQDFKAYYAREIGFRKALNYPPFSRIVMLRISGRDPEKTRMLANTLGRLCDRIRQGNRSFLNSVEFMGPSEAAIGRIAKQYRWQIFIKGRQLRALHGFVRRLMFENMLLFNNPAVSVTVDVDPISLM
ncbi:MAG: primosomal protein N' [Desulfobacterales bacterium]|nr:primosomal protein N' [Desulfobacterales bacterium]